MKRQGGLHMEDQTWLRDTRRHLPAFLILFYLFDELKLNGST